MRKTLSLLLLLAPLTLPAAAQRVPPADNSLYARAVAAGYKAAVTCSGVFEGGRTPEQIEGEELKGIYPEYDAIGPTLKATVFEQLTFVEVPFADDLPARRAEYNPGIGCVLLPIGTDPVGRSAIPEGPWRLTRPSGASPLAWPMGDAGIRPRPSPALAARVAAAFDRTTYGTGHTVGVVVLRDGQVAAERYARGWGPFTANRTWSVGKSIAGTLVGLAGLDPARPAPVPEWQVPGDPRAGITTDDLLRMASGLHTDTAGNRTDAVYFGGTAVTEQAPFWPLETKPGTRFRYSNTDILLAVRAMRATLGEERYRAYPSTALFAPLGMAHTVAEQDWRGNYVLSSQVWSTARDLARLGQFWLGDGVWRGRRLLPEGWVRYMTAPSGPQPADGPGYGATMWLFGPKQGLPAGSYAAQGNRGQYVLVIPSERLVVVRRGEDGGSARFDIAKFAADVATALR